MSGPEIEGPPSPAKPEDAVTQESADDDKLIRAVLAPTKADDLQDIIGDPDRAFDQSGKADDAIDFEDISDDDLPPEEAPAAPNSGEVPGLTDDGGTSNDTDDLFGEGQPSSPTGADAAGALRSSPRPDQAEAYDRDLNFDPETDFFSGTNQDPEIPGPPESFIDFVKQQWPGFEENAVLDLNILLAPKPAFWTGKKPAKPPKPLLLNKLSLEGSPDQEKTFKVHGTASVAPWHKHEEAAAKGLVCCEKWTPMPEAEMEAFDIDDEDSETVGGFTMADFEVVCDDWEALPGLAEENPATTAKSRKRATSDDDEGMDDAAWDAMFLEGSQPAKKRRIAPPKGLPSIPRYTAPSFDNFQQAALKLGKRVLLDMSDPYLLLVDRSTEPPTKRLKVTPHMVKMANGRSSRDLTSRFDCSNEDMYDALKENVTSKVRVTLANLNVEHSMPARRLLWPYYQVKLPASDPHSYHRPILQTRGNAHSTIRFSRLHNVSRKSLRGLRVHEVYKDSRDLSLNDNSTAVLFEFSEEIPTVLSNFGMGNRVINYHRKEGKENDEPPKKATIGELNILLPEDKSPFSIFGPIQPGETVPTLHNKMFHAPIFKHDPRYTDFLVGRSYTGQGGSIWYLRNIDHLFVVGQNLPIVDIPGPHSRRVTNTAKNRLKMIAYRMLHKQQSLSLTEITRHVADSNESQNRQKLKEFLDFHKDTKDWGLRQGEQLMSNATIMELLQPEDVCLMDAMQVGAHELENGGFDLSGDNLGARDDDDEKEEKLGNLSLAQQMVPWRTTRAFIEAAAGRAMVAVHGAGDPTGRGLGVSFIRISMKGGFLESLEGMRGPQATSAGAMERDKKQYGGHLYNVKDQDRKYQEAIEKVWLDQKRSLEDSVEHQDEDVQPREDEDDRFNMGSFTTQPGGTPAGVGADGFSIISRPSATSAKSGKSHRRLKITRNVRGADGEVHAVTEIVHDPAVIAQYIKRRRQLDEDSINIYGGVPDQAELDETQRGLLLKAIEAETERLNRNKERRTKREKQKMLDQKRKGGVDGSPDPSTEKGATTRKCANCGQVGHIKTNKKLCPMLNGTMAPTATPPGLNSSFGPINAPVAAGFSGTG